jgi:hypothetical protein
MVKYRFKFKKAIFLTETSPETQSRELSEEGCPNLEAPM